jgi:hypothetical protein
MATLLQPAELSFFDSDGNPLSAGTVTWYVPGTSTLKAIWLNAGQSVSAPNPQTLDAAGRCIAFGNGTYRQVVQDHLGNTIWDQVVGSASGLQAFDSTYAEAIGGYPKGTLLAASDGTGYWVNVFAGNTSNPDIGGAGWERVALQPWVSGNYAALSGATFTGQIVAPNIAVNSGFAMQMNGVQSLLSFANNQFIQYNPSSGFNYYTTGTHSFSGPIVGNSGIQSTGDIVANTGHLRAALGATGSGDGSIATVLNDFGSTLGSGGSAGYLRQALPSGAIIQAYYGTTATGNDTITFPTAFPNTCVEVVVNEGASQGWGGTTPTVAGVGDLASGSFALQMLVWNGAGWSLAAGHTYRYIAIGY